MGSHSVTCHPTQVNTPGLNPSQTGRYSIYLPRRDGRPSWPIGDLLHTEMVYPTADKGWSGVKKNPSSNRVECRLTTLIEANALTTIHSYVECSITNKWCTVVSVALQYVIYLTFWHRASLSNHYPASCCHRWRHEASIIRHASLLPTFRLLLYTLLSLREKKSLTDGVARYLSTAACWLQTNQSL